VVLHLQSLNELGIILVQSICVINLLVPTHEFFFSGQVRIIPSASTDDDEDDDDIEDDEFVGSVRAPKGTQELFALFLGSIKRC
jgi:hypothetical protein